MVFFIIVKVGFFIYVRLFSYQTAELRSEVWDAQDKVSVKVVNWQRYAAWDPTSDITDVTLKVDHPSGVRSRLLKIGCTSWENKNQFTGDYYVDAAQLQGSNDVVHVQVSQPSDGRIECHPTDVEFVREDFWRAANELDWRGISGIDDRVSLAQIIDHGNQKSIGYGAQLVNNTRWTTKSITFSCSQARISGPLEHGKFLREKTASPRTTMSSAMSPTSYTSETPVLR